MRCLGFVNQAELPGWYGCGDILALPSGREPWGLVVNEGMACGLIPVVSDAVGCAADLVRGVGEIFPAGDVAALAAALARAAATARGTAGSAARDRLSRLHRRARQRPVMSGRPWRWRAAAPRCTAAASRRRKDSATTASQSRTMPRDPGEQRGAVRARLHDVGEQQMIRNAPCTLRRRSATSSRIRIPHPSRNIPTISGNQPPCRYRSPSGVTSDEV